MGNSIRGPIQAFFAHDTNVYQAAIVSSGYNSAFTQVHGTPTGVYWQQITTPGINYVVWNEAAGEFYSLGNAAFGYPNAAYSHTGLNWSARSQSGLTSDVYYGVWYANSQLFTICYVSPGIWTIYRSTNSGSTWSAVNTSTWNGVPFCHAWNGTRHVFLGESNLTVSSIRDCYVSTDGATWTRNDLGLSDTGSIQWTDVKWNGSLFVATGAGSVSNKCITSTDGLTWNRRTLDSTNISWTALDYSPEAGIWVTVGDPTNTDGKVFATSTNGTSWTRRTFTPYVGTPYSWEYVRYCPVLRGFLVMARESGHISVSGRMYFSADGINWTQVLSSLNGDFTWISPRK
jgi:hypothetical protein